MDRKELIAELAVVDECREEAIEYALGFAKRAQDLASILGTSIWSAGPILHALEHAYGVNCEPQELMICACLDVSQKEIARHLQNTRRTSN